MAIVLINTHTAAGVTCLRPGNIKPAKCPAQVTEVLFRSLIQGLMAGVTAGRDNHSNFRVYPLVVSNVPVDAPMLTPINMCYLVAFRRRKEEEKRGNEKE